MKYFILLPLSLFLIPTLTAQIEPSSCEATQPIINAYHNDADQLAMKYIFDNNLSYVNDPILPSEIVQPIMDALTAVYNVENIPERDTVVSMNPIHAFPLYLLDEILISADDSVDWMQDLINGNLNTANSTLNDYIALYNLNLVEVFQYTSFTYAQFSSNQNYNIIALADQMAEIENTNWAEPNGIIGDGNDIEVTQWTDDYIELTYSLGWGDCPAGCTCRRYWSFKIYNDCSVEFVNSYGCQLSPTHVGEVDLAKITAFPTLFTDNIAISNTNHPLSYDLYNTLGILVSRGVVRNNQINELSSLSTGVYYLRLVTETNKTKTIKLIKQ